MTYDSRWLVNILLICALILVLITFVLLILASINPQLFQTAGGQETGVASGVEGTVMLGPTCPVQRIGDLSCNDKPYPTTVEVYQSGGQNVYKSVKTDNQAYFKIGLNSGSYLLKPVTGKAIFPRCSEQTVTVPPNQFINVTLTCDTGIR